MRRTPDPRILPARIATEFARVQIFDRSMTLAAQAFTSVFPVLILLGAVLGPSRTSHISDLAHVPESSRRVIDEALSHQGIGAFGVLGSLVVLLSSTGLARALARAYGAVWSVPRTPTGPRAAWRWFATVLLLALFAVGTRMLGRLTAGMPLAAVWSAVLLLLADCTLAVLLPLLLLAHTLPVRSALPGGLAFGLMMLAVRPVGARYLPWALRTSEERYGAIGVAFTYIGWLYILAFCLLLAAVVGHAIEQERRNHPLRVRDLRGDSREGGARAEREPPAGIGGGTP
ncbi:YhjD/YihY/BrkB family envelope integrity protein [Actinoplanes sp. NPDC049681]|uniref:YhjD/YihY/BrkB family envelope integrity protein n=1 Tax=Actinoplanes sp. NPDC049681 TaxID=3363905 RepID=UPI0037A7CD6B